MYKCRWDIMYRSIYYFRENIGAIFKYVNRQVGVPLYLNSYLLTSLGAGLSISRIRNYCYLTSRSRGTVFDYRLSRHLFKYYVYSGYLVGVLKL